MSTFRTYIAKQKDESVEHAIHAYEEFPHKTPDEARRDVTDAGLNLKDFTIYEITARKVGDKKRASKRSKSKSGKRSSN